MQKFVIFVKKNNHNHKRVTRRIWKIIYLVENTEKYITFSVPVQKEVTRINKNGEEMTKIASYRLQFIDSVRFRVSSLSNLVNNLAEGIHEIRCKNEHDE